MGTHATKWKPSLNGFTHIWSHDEGRAGPNGTARTRQSWEVGGRASAGGQQCGGLDKITGEG